MTTSPKFWHRLVLVLAACLCAFCPAHAQSKASINQTKSKLQAATKDVREQQAVLRSIKKKQAALRDDYDVAQRAVSKAEHRLRETVERLNLAERVLDRNKSRLKEVTERLTRHTDLFWRRMAVFYKNSSMGYIEVALGSADFEQFVDRSTLMRRIAESDFELQQQIIADKAEQSQLVKLNAATVKQREEQKLAVAMQTEELKQAREELARRRAKLGDQRAQEEQEYDELSEAQREIAAKLASLTRPRWAPARSSGASRIYRSASPASGGGDTNFGGRFMRPVGGRITSAFGWRIHPILRTRRFHDGVDIAAPSGTTIRAAAAGTVVHAGWMRAYGNTLMINHGNGYVTMYGHCSSLVVGEGTQVAQGQPVARVGSTGWSTGPHLHFTVYLNGSAVSPLR